MNKNPKIQTHKFSLNVSDSTYDNLQKLAAKNHVTVAEIARRFINEGLSLESFADRQDTIRQYLREEIESVLPKQIDRIIRLQLKATQASAASMFANIKTLADSYINVTEFENILALSLKEAHAYMKLKEQPFEFFLNEARKLTSSADGITDINDMGGVR